jgi:hypothetical protein
MDWSKPRAQRLEREMSHTNATCMACGEQGHKSSTCKTLRIPPEGFYTGGGGGGGHSHDEDDEMASIGSRMPYMLNNSKGDGIPSKLLGQVYPIHRFPNKPSNVLVRVA